LNFEIYYHISLTINQTFNKQLLFCLFTVQSIEEFSSLLYSQSWWSSCGNWWDSSGSPWGGFAVGVRSILMVEVERLVLGGTGAVGELDPLLLSEGLGGTVDELDEHLW